MGGVLPSTPRAATRTRTLLGGIHHEAEALRNHSKVIMGGRQGRESNPETPRCLEPLELRC